MNVRLVAYKGKVYKTGVTAGPNPNPPWGTWPVWNIPLQLTVAGADATLALKVGDVLVTAENEEYGQVTIIVDATTIWINRLRRPLVVGEQLYTVRENTYQLDLQESPNVALNFQFADIKEPDKRKASYSQTFKLPFTQRNNAFFENWFNVNLQTPVFNSRKKFAASLFIGTIPQFEGVIQLKGVYLKAGYYDVILLSNSADLFTKICSQKVKDVYKLDTGLYSEELNHIYNDTNIQYSWNGWSNAFVNYPAGESLQDADAGVQKVMYPFSFTMPKAWFNPGFAEYFNMDEAEILDIGYDAAAELMVDILQFRPAIQVKEIWNKIMAKAGFSYTSTFLTSDYFGKLFMTTCNHRNTPGPAPSESGGSVDGYMSVGHSVANWGKYGPFESEDYSGNPAYPPNNNFDCWASEWTDNTPWIQVRANTVTPLDPALYTLPYDANDLWNEGGNFFTKESVNMTQLRVEFVAYLKNIIGQGEAYYNPAPGYGDWTCETPEDGIMWEIELRDTTGSWLAYDVWWQNTGYWDTGEVNNYVKIDRTLDISDPTNFPIGTQISIFVRCRYFCRATNTVEIPAWIEFGSSQCTPIFYSGSYTTCGLTDCLTDPEITCYEFSGLYNRISCEWTGATTNQWNSAVDVVAGIDPTLTQKDFLKDIIQRFNLIVLSDPDNPTNLIIEPYNDYIASGELKDWTNKVDLDKEIVISDTTSLQKERVLFTDKEDVDLLNKSIKEMFPTQNVYGKYDVRETNNEFATGEMKNTPVFAPYINEQIFVGNDPTLDTYLTNVAAQYEYTYKKVDDAYEDVLEPTKPKLFYYNGSSTSILGATGGIVYMHHYDPYTGEIIPHEFTRFPLCSPFELDPSASGDATITADTKSLYWGQNGPVAGNLGVFNYTAGGPLIIKKNLFNYYWEQYLNGLYSIDAKIMDCYISFNAVDIFNFKFSDEIFIKDAYWRVLTIKNYQVGAKTSTKVQLIKVNQAYESTCVGCDYVVGEVGGNNTVGPFYVWCPAGDADCTPDITAAGDWVGLLTTEDCCYCQGGEPLTWYNSPTGLYPCIANTGSLPYQLQSMVSPRSLLRNNTKSMLSGKFNGRNQPLVAGTNNIKSASNLLPNFGNDVVIKYENRQAGKPQSIGESHRIVLSGNTIGNTRGFAVAQGKDSQRKLTVPDGCNMILRVKGTSTVVGGKSSTYTLNYTEGFAYYTAFKNVGGDVTQLSTVGGQEEFSIREGANPTTCTLNIIYNNGYLEFGLDDDQTDTRRVWNLTADIDVNLIYNMYDNFDDEYAQYQNYTIITFQDQQRLIWN